MAGPITIAFVSDVLIRLTSGAIQQYGLLTGLESDLSALKKTFKQIQGVLHDAEKKQTTQKGVEEWLRTLKSASLEVENLLDEAKTEAKIQIVCREMGKRYKIRAFFSHHRNPNVVKFKIAHELKNIRKKLEDINVNRSIQLTPTNVSEYAVGIGGKISERETSSLMSKIYGREEEKKMMIAKICNQDLAIRHDDDDVQVYAITGMGGIGKTTLAQYVYNHEVVKTHFEFKCWVHVSAVFDVKRLIKRIIKAIYGLEDLKLEVETKLENKLQAVSLDDVRAQLRNKLKGKKRNLEAMSLDDLQRELQRRLKGKKYFIIMDDVWIESKDMQKWGELYKGLSCGAKGSTVMVTTRKEDTAQLMAKNPGLRDNVGVLSKEVSWSLFKMLAFSGRGEGENIMELEPIGRKIVEKCQGLPLAVTTVGTLMSLKSTVNEWQLENEKFMSEMQDNGILPALRLSYDDLLPHWKRCFAYCCVFSKGEEMSKDSLIELWMANEFIPPQEDVSLYKAGEEIFKCLVERSFFQGVTEKNIHKGEIFKMHDLMHDLAQYVMRYDCAVKETGKKLIIPDEVLHFGLSYGDFQFAEEDLKKLRSLRSMFVLNDDYRSSLGQISNHAYLRVLYLNKIQSSTLPESISKLIHLRYLKIEHSAIQVLPDTILYLQNLQTLIIEWCSQFHELPRRLRFMRNLQRLDVDNTVLSHFPVGIEELTNLRRLAHFVVGKSEGARIGELGNLNLLGRELMLSRLHNVGGLSDAKSAKLKDKTNLRALKLSWARSGHQTSESEVLEGLEPNSSLQELYLYSYTGMVISPSWLVKLVNLTTIQFCDLENCEGLPALGKLPSLKFIALQRMGSLKCFHDDDNVASKDDTLYPSLQELSINRCPSLVSLPSNFPKMCSLYISFCDELRSLPDEIKSFKDLTRVTIKYCAILRIRCGKETGDDWHKISHIAHLEIQ